MKFHIVRAELLSSVLFCIIIVPPCRLSRNRRRIRHHLHIYSLCICRTSRGDYRYWLQTVARHHIITYDGYTRIFHKVVCFYRGCGGKERPSTCSTMMKLIELKSTDRSECSKDVTRTTCVSVCHHTAIGESATIDSRMVDCVTFRYVRW